MSYAFFYNSINGDRVYNSDSFEHLIKKFFTSGVFLNDLHVTANDDMSVNVGMGYVNADGKVKVFESNNTLKIETAGATYPRIDSIVLERNDTERDILLKVIKGGYSSNPIAHVPVRQDGVYQLVIAQIRVNAGAVKISQLDITDTRSNKELCGIVAGAVDQIDFSQIQVQFDAYVEKYKDELAEYEEQMQADFEAWFQNIRNQLDEDAAGHLQNQIDDINEQLENVGGSRVEVTVDDAGGEFNVVGLTVNLEIDGQTYSKKVPSEKVVVFQVLEVGTANISCVDEAQGYDVKGSVEIPCYSAYEITLASGGFRVWLEAGGYTKEQYPTVEDVLADEKAVRKLMTVHASCDAFVDWYNMNNSMLAQFTGNRVAMKWIGLRDYIADKLLAIPSVAEQLLTSEHWEYILKDKVPTMTSNTAPEGTVSASSTFSGYYAYSAFDGKDNTGWMPLANAKNISLSYKFNNPIAIKKFSVIMQKFNSVTDVTLELRASNDGVYWVTLDTFTSGSTERVIDNDTPYLHYGIYSPEALAVEGVGYWEIRTLQFYGRFLNESVPVMTSNTAPLGEVSASSVYQNTYAPYNVFGGNVSWYSALNVSLPQHIAYKFIKPIAVRAVSLINSGAWIPKEFDIEGSNNGSDWVKLGSFTNQNINERYGETKCFFENDEAFLNYRLVVNTVHKFESGSTEQCVGINALQFYGVSYSEEEFGSDGIEMLYDNGVEVGNIELHKSGSATVTKADDYVTSKSASAGGIQANIEKSNSYHYAVGEYNEKTVNNTLVYLEYPSVSNATVNVNTNTATHNETITSGRLAMNVSAIANLDKVLLVQYNTTTTNKDLAKLRKLYLIK